MKRFMKLAALGAAFLLAGCTADLQRAKDLSVGDGLQYVEDNHTFRQQLRSEYRQAVLSEFKKCTVKAAGAESSLDAVATCIEWAKGHYPSLATIELLREGAQGVNELVPLIRGIGEE